VPRLYSIRHSIARMYEKERASLLRVHTATLNPRGTMVGLYRIESNPHASRYDRRFK
jgi:hypothetical protein